MSFFRLNGILLAALVCACGDGGKDSASASSVCQQLEGTLCDRTTECAIEAGRTASADREQFRTRCLASLARYLTCSEPVDGDQELCTDALQQLSCDRVVASLDRGEVTAPSTSCADYFF